MSFSTDQANPDYNPNYDTPSPKSIDIAGRANALKKRLGRRLSPGRISRAARGMEHEPSLEKKPCNGLFCGLFSGGKRRTKRDAKREELNLVERQNVGERAAAEQNAVEEKDNLKKRTIII